MSTTHRNVYVDGFWWDELCKRVRRLKDEKPNLSAYGILCATADVMVSAVAVVESSERRDPAKVE